MISIANGIAQWDYQVRRFYARVGGQEFVAPTTAALGLQTPLLAEEIVELEAMKSSHESSAALEALEARKLALKAEVESLLAELVEAAP